PCRREPEHAILAPQVEVHALLELLHEDAAVAVHNRLRQTGGARGVEHPQRVLERDLLKVKLRSLAAREKLPPAQGSGPGPVAVLRGARVQIWQRDRALHGGQLSADALDHTAAVEVLAPVAVSIDRDQDLGLDLREAVDHAA